MRDYEVTMEDLSYELEMMLEALLLSAGVKKDCLQKACDLYVENIDDVLENAKSQGAEGILEVMEFLKKNYKELFS